MLPTKQVDTNYGYDGNYKETNCLEEYGVFKSKSQDSDIKEEKPDIYIGAEDIWAFNGYTKKKWYYNDKLSIDNKNQLNNLFN